MKSERFLFCVLFFAMAFHAFGQTAAAYEANYAKRIKLEMINGVYIPIDLNDAFSELTRLSDKPGIEKFRIAPDSLIDKSHFGLQKWIELNWGFDEGSRLSHYMKQKGISLPDDMSRVIVLMYHRFLNGQPLRFEEEITEINTRLEKEKMKRDSSKVILSVQKRPHKE